MLEYDSDFNQVNKRRIHLNRLTSFIVSPKAVYCRIAIRLSGQGELEVFNVFTSESIPKAMKAQKIGDSKPLDQIKVAAILNEEQLQDMTDVVTIITIDNWDESSSTAIPDLLLVDSSLRNSSIDSGKTRVNTTYQTLKQMILWCKKITSHSLLGCSWFDKSRNH
ncbi:hypothetical protein CV093_18755 [Oceanobacillus sp. 143]|nr:hypothetical protein CV093_18755 [Oceanobacillus sp. 143]